MLVGLRSVDKRRLGTYIVLTVLAVAVANSTFDIYDDVLKLLNRNPTLTERTFLWDALFKVEVNPVLGVGFESFWLGERQQKLWTEIGWHANEAHNGYLETYLNMGLVGLFLLIGLLFATFFKIRRNLLRNLEWGRFQFGFLIATVAYNWTESGFKTLHPVWFVFFLIAIDYPRPQLPFTGQSFEVASGENSWVVVAQDES